MVTKQKINHEKVQAALNTVCPKCGYVIPPGEIRRVDFSLVECPSCGERFTPGNGTKAVRA
jgi:ribosomal protein L32